MAPCQLLAEAEPSRLSREKHIREEELFDKASIGSVGFFKRPGRTVFWQVFPGAMSSISERD
jgi:hypothetical protein